VKEIVAKLGQLNCLSSLECADDSSVTILLLPILLHRLNPLTATSGCQRYLAGPFGPAILRGVFIGDLNLSQSSYRTTYACEGMEMNIECEAGHVINVIRANYGRFSITICNTHGNTEWSVNCQSMRTLHVLADRCNGKHSCSTCGDASTAEFGDGCPGTFKYLEAHYQCQPLHAITTTTTARPRPPWFLTTRPPIWQPPALSTNFTTTSQPTTITTTTASTTTTSSTTKTSTTATTLPPATSPILLLDDELAGMKTTQEDPVPTTAGSIGATIALPVPSGPAIYAPITPNITTPRRKLPPHLAPPAVGSVNSDYESTWCPPSFVRGLLWNWTREGNIAVQPCPGGASGWARRTCLSKGWEDYSDLSECHSVWLNAMESRVEEKESLLNIANDLATVTESKALYGGDLITTARLLSTLTMHMVNHALAFPDPRHQKALVTEMFQAVLTTSSSLLAKSMTGPCCDLSAKERHHAVTKIMVALEEAAFLLADVIPPDTEVAHYKSHILASVRAVVGNGNSVYFPSAKDQTHDWSFAVSVSLPPEAVLENSNRGVTRVVFLTYHHLEDMLAPGNDGIGPSTSYRSNTSRFINSRVVSASLGQGRHIQLPMPVTITFALLHQENVSKPICAFWDYTTEAWLDEGCLVLCFNHTHVTCQCDHLTHFAVLMEESTLRILGYVGCVLALIFVAGSMLVFSVFQSLHSPHTAVLRHACLCVSLAELVFLLGVWRTSDLVLCGIIAGVLHYTLLAAFAWMFMEGVHVYLSVARAVECDSLRLRWWHYILAYGLPLLVVSVAIIVDPFCYGSPTYCFLRNDNYFVLSLVGPALLLLLAKLTLLAAALIYSCRLVPDDSLKIKEMARLESTRLWLGGYFTLLILMVVTWSLGLVSLHQPSLPIAAAFCVVNALHGVFICIYYCLRNKKVLDWCQCGSSSSEHSDGAWLPQVMHGVFTQDKQIYSPSTNTSNSTVNPAINHTLTHGLSNNHQATAPNLNQHLPNLCQLNGVKGTKVGMGRGVDRDLVGGSISMSVGPMGRGHLPLGPLHQSLPRHHMHSMPPTTYTTNIHHATLDSNEEDASFKSFLQDSRNGYSQQEDSPHTAWNNTHDHHYSNSLTTDLKKSYFAKLNRINITGGTDRNSPFPHIDGNKLITVPNSYTTQLSSTPMPPAVVVMLKGNSNTAYSHSPWNHNYMEIGTESSDPVYEEIEHEIYLNRGGQTIQGVRSLTSGEAMHLSYLSDEYVNYKTPSDMSHQSSHSYGDARPLLPYNSHQMTHARPNQDQQYALSEERLCDFKAAQISQDLEQLQHAQQQYNQENIMTVAVLNGEQVVCHITSPSNPNQPQSVPIIHEASRGGFMVSQPQTNGYPAHLVIGRPQCLNHNSSVN
ncbi:unnamed protein product, partial [Meganyctiphanes norvegica]